MTLNKNLLNKPRDHDSDLWQTPQDLFDKLDEEFNFKYDVCQNGTNGLKPYLGDYFTTEYKDCICFMNPPYSKPNKFIERAIELVRNNVTTVCLLKSDTSTKIFHRLYYDLKFEVRFIKGRIKFNHPTRTSKVGPVNANLIVIIK